ncbi:hypothetical protein AVEN_139887-1 [Araneus ventricosus]|uniref:Uncharacterized protein n=1 Tax=Araneus ventricosus TaxID=182803 RepID=A0A4Y2FLV1_ARAVE|nr:hypothetical protein AVEN_139887-1 [Araneus ventricosus]
MWICCMLHHMHWVKRPPIGVAWKFGEGCELRCRPRHLTVVQNYEVREKIALVLPFRGTLILKWPVLPFNNMRPRWPRGKVSGSGPEASRFETRFY